MESILWTQGGSAAEKAVFVIDGAVATHEAAEVLQGAYDKLMTMGRRRAKHPEIVRILYKQGMIGTEQFKLTYAAGEGIYFQSVYKSLDDAGRRIAYMFFCHTNDIDLACQTFKTFSEKAGRAIEEAELNALRLLVNINRYALYAGIAVLITWIVWKIAN